MKILMSAIIVGVVSFSLAKAEEINFALLPKDAGRPKAGFGLINPDNGRASLGFGGLSTPGYKFPTSDASKTCDSEGTPSLDTGVARLSARVNSSLDFFACRAARYNAFAKYTTESCQNAVACRQNLENSGVEIRKSQKKLNELIANDYIKNAMVVNNDDMERFQVMKKFAQEKFDKNLGSQCINRFTTQGVSNCEAPLIEKAFEERQADCEYGIGCYNRDEAEFDIDSFAKFKSKNDDKVGKLMKSYFIYRTDKLVKKKTSEDDKRVEDLKKLASNAEFKKAKQDKKIEMIIAAIGKDNLHRLKDPILSFEFGAENPASAKNAVKFKEILKMLESKTAEKDFEKSFNEYRKKRAEFHLNGANSCAQTNTIISICNQATLIADGENVPMEVDKAESYTSQDMKKSGVAYELLKGILGSNYNDEDYGAILNARRCIIFGYVDEFGHPKAQPTKEDIASSRTGDISSGKMNSAEANGVQVFAASDSPVKASTSADISVLDEAGLRSRSVSTASSGDSEKAPRSISDEKPLDEVGGSGISTPPVSVAQPQVASNFSDMYNSGNFDSFAGKPKAKVEDEAAKGEDATSAKGVVPSSQDKMNEYLMKKLAAAEENLEKLKADAEAAEADKAKQKKIDEETALIKDLKGQIADLKTQSAKNNERKIASVAAAEEARIGSASTSSHSLGSSSGGFSSSARSELPAPKAQSSEKYDTAAAAAREAQQTIRTAGSGLSSGAILSSVNNADGSKTTTLGSGLVVTTIDGMTSEKAQQTISNRIIELNGSPFYIEEGGMVKEIIAVVKDGKVLLDEKGNPIFEKIVKGKVGDKKFVAKAKDKNDRAPAAIVDVADLKRQEDKLRERAEYLKLKNLTNGALKNK